MSAKVLHFPKLSACPHCFERIRTVAFDRHLDECRALRGRAMSASNSAERYGGRATHCSCPQSDTYRQLDRDCPQHGDEAENRRRGNGAASDRHLDECPVLRSKRLHPSNRTPDGDGAA